MEVQWHLRHCALQDCSMDLTANQTDLLYLQASFLNNIYLIGAFVVGLALVTMVVMIPGLHSIFKVQTLNLTQLLIVYGLAAVNIPIIQILKAIRLALKKKEK